MGLFHRPRTMDPEEIERMKADITSLRDALDRYGTSARDDVRSARAGQADHGARLDQLAAKLAELDARVTAVSKELTNQITELGNDIDSLNDRPSPNGADSHTDEAVMGELRDGQVRLANEQARYQLAFRQDLARLAEQLRRPA